MAGCGSSSEGAERGGAVPANGKAGPEGPLAAEVRPKASVGSSETRTGAGAAGGRGGAGGRSGADAEGGPTGIAPLLHGDGPPCDGALAGEAGGATGAAPCTCSGGNSWR